VVLGKEATMPDLMNMTKEEYAELIDVLEREQGQLQLGIDRSGRRKEQPTGCDQLDMVRRLLWKARAGSSTPSILDPSELLEYRLAGYC
jgi:hypothetical protein